MVIEALYGKFAPSLTKIKALAPVIAQGESQAAGALTDFTQIWANIDATTKNRVLSAYQLALGGAEGLPSQTGEQRFLTNFLQGLNLGVTAYGNTNYAQGLKKQSDLITDLPKYFMSGNEEDLSTIYKKMFAKGAQ